MAKQTINTGSRPNSRDGDSLRAAFTKINANFTELYTALGLDSGGLNLGAFEFTGSTISTTDSSGITIDQATTISSDLNVGGDILPIAPNGGNLGSSANPWRSLYVSNNTIFIGGNALKIDSNGDLTLNNNRIVQENGEFLVLDNLTDVSANSPSVGDVLTWNGGSWVNAGQGGTTGDITFANSTISAADEDEIIIQAKDADSFASARLSLEPVYGTATLTAYSSENVDTFTLADGDFATGVWQNNGYNIGVITFTGAQNIGNFFQNILTSLTPENVTIIINSEPAFEWNGGTSGSGSSTPGLTSGALFPASPLSITSIEFRSRKQSYINVNQDNNEIRLNAQSAGIEMSADLNVRVFADDQIEIQAGEELILSAGLDINISNGSNDTINMTTGDLNITAFDDVNFRGSDSFRIRNTSTTAPIRIITDDNNTQRTWAFNPDGNLTLPGNLQSDGNVNIEINLEDSTKRIWQFGEDGLLTFPDGTSQNSAGISASSTDTFTNKTINIQAGQGNVFQIQGNSISSYSGSGNILALTSMPTFSGLNVNNSSLSIDGGTGSYYANTVFADGTGTIHKAGVYKSANDANNALFTFGANGAGTMSVVMDGSLFIGSALPSNNGGLNTNYGGWLVVQAGAKFGGDLNTLGNFILDTPGNYVRFGDGTMQTTAADFGYLDLDKDTIKGTADYQYTFATDGYFTSSTSSESTNYFFVTYNTTNANIAAGWTVVGGTANTTVSSVTYPVAGYPGVIRVNLTAAASSTSGFYPVTVTSPDRLRVEIQPNPSTSDKFTFTTSGLTFPDATVQTTAYTGYHTGDMTGSVFADDSTIMVDAVDNKIYANTGSINDLSTQRVTLPNNSELRSSSVAYDAALANWEATRSGELQNYIDLGLATLQTFPMPGWNPTGLTAQGYIDFIENAWAAQQAGGPLIIIPPISSSLRNALRSSLIAIRDSYPLIGSGVSIATKDAWPEISKAWNFGDDGNLTIPGDIRSQGNINIDINLSDSTLRRWTFGEDGNLDIPGNISQRGSPGLTIGSSHNVYIVGDQGDNNRTWTFDGTSGDTELPNGTVIADDGSDGIEIVMPTTTAQANTFKWRFTDLAIGTSTLSLTPGTLDTNLDDWYFGFNSTKYLGMHGATQSISWFSGGEGGGKVIFGAPAGNNAGDVNAIELKATDGDVYLTSTESVKITVDANDSSARVWTFDPTGELTAPGAVTVGGILKIEDGVHEKLQTKTSVTGTVEHDCSAGHIFYHITPQANWTVNLTNLNLANGYATAITIVIEQGGTGYYPSAVQIDGNGVPHVWQGNTTPTPSNSRIDVVTFSIINDGLYTVLGQLTGF